jgi:hypothetical protein
MPAARPVPTGRTNSFGISSNYRYDVMKISAEYSHADIF